MDKLPVRPASPQAVATEHEGAGGMGAAADTDAPHPAAHSTLDRPWPVSGLESLAAPPSQDGSQWLLEQPHFLTVAGAAQALISLSHLFPVSPASQIVQMTRQAPRTKRTDYIGRRLASTDFFALLRRNLQTRRELLDLKPLLQQTARP